jgi:hypothetical protein
MDPPHGISISFKVLAPAAQCCHAQASLIRILRLSSSLDREVPRARLYKQKRLPSNVYSYLGDPFQAED